MLVRTSVFDDCGRLDENNMSILEHVGRHCLLADIPAIIGSIDVVMGEVDR